MHGLVYTRKHANDNDGLAFWHVNNRHRRMKMQLPRNHQRLDLRLTKEFWRFQIIFEQSENLSKFSSDSNGCGCYRAVEVGRRVAVRVSENSVTNPWMPSRPQASGLCPRNHQHGMPRWICFIHWRRPVSCLPWSRPWWGCYRRTCVSSDFRCEYAT
jgi:hypothetical protein